MLFRSPSGAAIKRLADMCYCLPTMFGGRFLATRSWGRGEGLGGFMHLFRSVVRVRTGLGFGLALWAATGGAAQAAPSEPTVTEVAAMAAIQPPADAFRSAFLAWKSLDGPQHAQVTLPSRRPLEGFRYTSSFGVRSDPFNGGAALHTGVDLAAPTGTQVHATGDAVVSRAEWAGGYGNMIQLDHGAGVQTRYGHLSRVLVHAGQRVHAGDVIGLVGSTGRSTGSHLHYEVRVADRAINPLPFMALGDDQLALQQTVGSSASRPTTAMGGPDYSAD